MLLKRVELQHLTASSSGLWTCVPTVYITSSSISISADDPESSVEAEPPARDWGEGNLRQFHGIRSQLGGRRATGTGKGIALSPLGSGSRHTGSGKDRGKPHVAPTSSNRPVASIIAHKYVANEQAALVVSNGL